MRVLLAADLHGSMHGVKVIHETIDKTSPDLFIVCGDLTDFGPVSFAREFLQDIHVKTFAVPGNCDPPEIVRDLEELGVNLHGKKAGFGGSTFVGLGGSNPTPFNTDFELPEEEIARILGPIMEPGVILVSHPPPFGFCDAVRGGQHAGSKAVREAVDRFQPRLVMTGHIHEARGISRGPTTVVNPGFAAKGELAIVNLDGEIEIELI